jgi:hypothetical protein
VTPICRTRTTSLLCVGLSDVWMLASLHCDVPRMYAGAAARNIGGALRDRLLNHTALSPSASAVASLPLSLCVCVWVCVCARARVRRFCRPLDKLLLGKADRAVACGGRGGIIALCRCWTRLTYWTTMRSTCNPQSRHDRVHRCGSGSMAAPRWSSAATCPPAQAGRRGGGRGGAGRKDDHSVPHIMASGWR